VAAFSTPTSDRSRTTLPTRKGKGTRVFLGGHFSHEDLVSFGGISEKAAIRVQSSDCIHAQPNSDATQLEHAHKLAMAKDCDYIQGKKLLPEFTLASLPNDLVITRASKLGISLGSSPSQISSSINGIKDLDME
jgi:hypothetical protein